MRQEKFKAFMNNLIPTKTSIVACLLYHVKVTKTKNYISRIKVGD